MPIDDYATDYPPSQHTFTAWPLLLVAALAALVLWRFWPHEPSSGLDPNAVPRPIVARGDLADEEKATIALYKQTSPSVVHVTRIVEERDLAFDIHEYASGSGSGFVWDDDGHIVTNNHVIAGASGLRVVLGNRDEFKATLVGTQPDIDLAVLKIDVPKGRLHPIMVGTSHDLQVGQRTYAIGNPFGLDQSLTTGVVSALDREIKDAGRSLKGLIQTSAAINPGNSGGPLLDSAGRLIGVNTAIVSPSGASAGVGFAIPVDEVNRIVPELIRHGKVARPGLGVRVAFDQLNQQLGIEGVLIFDVLPGSPAAKAGLRSTRREAGGSDRLGDIIIALDDKPIHTMADLHAALDERQVGDTVVLTIERDNHRQKVSVTLEAIR
jgi:S1-C subfamily serine protease